jgi:integrase/recombinase XerC
MSDLIAGYRRHLRDLGRTPATISTYLGVLTRMDRELPYGLDVATTDELRAWIYADGHGRATRKLYRAAVRQFFAWACDPDAPALDYNPTRRLPAVKVPRRAPKVPDAAEVRLLLATADRPFRDWFLLASHAGLRCIEISRLRRQDITQDGVWVDGKGDKARIVDTHELVWEAFRDRPRGLIASGLDARAISQQGNRRLRAVLAGSEWTMHSLRRWFGTGVWKASKYDLFVTQELLGHASPVTTQRSYVAIPGDRKRAAVDGLPVVA